MLSKKERDFMRYSSPMIKAVEDWLMNYVDKGEVGKGPLIIPTNPPAHMQYDIAGRAKLFKIEFTLGKTEEETSSESRYIGLIRDGVADKQGNRMYWTATDDKVYVNSVDKCAQLLRRFYLTYNDMLEKENQ